MSLPHLPVLSGSGAMKMVNLTSYGSTATGSASHSGSADYDEQVSLINNISPNTIDFKVVNKHLVNHEDTLKMQGGDVTRHLYHQIENKDKDKKRTRSSLFSTFVSSSRRESTASDINVPGGFRREFIIQKLVQQHKLPPNFLTSNFVEFLSIYGHFAGENFDDGESVFSEETFEEVFDEESLLLDRRYPQLKRRKAKKSEPKGTASQIKTFFLLFKALVGSGVLFLPRAFCNGGLLFSTVILTLFGFLTYMCYIVLIQSKRVFKRNSYGELGFLTYGRPLNYCILVSIIISQVGFVATYILFTTENMALFLQSTLGISVAKSTIVIWQCVLLVPLVLIRDLAKLSFTSLVSSAFILVGLFIIFYYSGAQLLNEGLGPNIQQFNSKSWSMLIGVAVTSFEGVGLILPIESSMAHPEKFPLVLLMSMIVITALFTAIGVIGYTAFGENVKSIIILNLPSGSIAVKLILVLYSIAVFLSAPLQLFPAIRIGESAIFNSRLFLTAEELASLTGEGKLYSNSGKYHPQIKWMKNLFRALSVFVISFLAYLNANNIDRFVSFNGCFACIPLVYIYPPLVHLKTYEVEKNDSLRGRCLKIFDYVLVVVGIVVVVYTTYQILFGQ